MKNNNTQFIRAVLILMVIVIHSISECSYCENFVIILFRTLCNLAVPIFFFISGYYFNVKKYENNKRKYIFNKVTRLLIPLLIWNVIYFLLSQGHEFKRLVTFSSAGHLYFIVVLIQLILITPLILKLYNKTFFRCIVYISTPLYLIIYRILWIKYNIDIPLHQYYFFAWIIYYMEGIRYRNYRITTYKLTKLMKIGMCVLFLLVYIYNTVIYVNVGFDYSLSQMNVLNMLNALLIFRFIYYFIMKDKKVTNKLLIDIGNKSFGIYFIHMLMLRIVDMVFKGANMHIYIIIIKIILTLAMSYICMKLFEKFNNKRLNKILGF